MPFTASHPALILMLLKKRWLSASGLLMGSMVPDFEFFLRMKAEGPYGHTLLGMFWLNIPIAIGLIFIYHGLVRDPLIKSLPAYFERRMRLFLTFDWVAYFRKNYGKVLLSIVLGNLSHLLWDAFTHFDGFFVTKIPFLNTLIWSMPLYDFLQYGCSLLGALAIWYYIAALPMGRTKPGEKNKLVYWLLVGVVCAIVMGMRFWNTPVFHFGDRIVSLLFSFMVGLLAASLWGLYHQKIGMRKTRMNRRIVKTKKP